MDDRRCCGYCLPTRLVAWEVDVSIFMSNKPITKAELDALELEFKGPMSAPPQVTAGGYDVPCLIAEHRRLADLLEICREQMEKRGLIIAEVSQYLRQWEETREPTNASTLPGSTRLGGTTGGR